MWLEMENGFYRLDYDHLYLETSQKHDWHQAWEVKFEEAMTEEGKQDNSLPPIQDVWARGFWWGHSETGEEQ